jgi:hypothetical protein
MHLRWVILLYGIIGMPQFPFYISVSRKPPLPCFIIGLAFLAWILNLYLLFPLSVVKIVSSSTIIPIVSGNHLLCHWPLRVTLFCLKPLKSLANQTPQKQFVNNFLIDTQFVMLLLMAFWRNYAHFTTGMKHGFLPTRKTTIRKKKPI